MAEKHGVVRTDLLAGTDVRSGLVSAKYMGSGDTATAIDNGNVIKIESLVEGEREIYKGVTPAASDALEDIILVASPEVMYDERLVSLEDFYNEADEICRGYRLHENDIFSVTAEALEGSPDVNQKVALDAATKLKVGGEGTEVGTIIAKDIVGRYTYYVIKVSAPAAAAPVI